MISSLLRRPAATSILSLIGVLAFYVIFGGVDLGKLMNAASWLNYAARIGIVALPIGLLMISGEIDISIGAMIPAGAMTTAIISGHYELPMIFGILGALGVGVILGTINGVLAVRTNVPTLVITLATLVGMQGVVLAGSKLLTGSASVPLTGARLGQVDFRAADVWRQPSGGDSLVDHLRGDLLVCPASKQIRQLDLRHGR